MKKRSCLVTAAVLIVVLLLLLTIGPDLFLNCYYAVHPRIDSAALVALRESDGFQSLVLASKIAQWLNWIVVPVVIVGGFFLYRGKR
jgi:hypothetical protein